MTKHVKSIRGKDDFNFPETRCQTAQAERMRELEEGECAVWRLTNAVKYKSKRQLQLRPHTSPERVRHFRTQSSMPLIVLADKGRAVVARLTLSREFVRTGAASSDVQSRQLQSATGSLHFRTGVQLLRTHVQMLEASL